MVTYIPMSVFPTAVITDKSMKKSIDAVMTQRNTVPYILPMSQRQPDILVSPMSDAKNAVILYTRDIASR